MEILPLQKKLYSEWDNYVHSHSEGSPFHLSPWMEAVEKSFGHKSSSFLLTDRNKICGVLPLTQIKSLLFGNILSSIPFAAYGGIVADNEKYFQLLLDHAKKQTRDLNADYLDLKFQFAKETDLPETDLHVTFIKELFQEHEENMKAIPRKQRAMVRKGIKSGLNAHYSRDYLDDFYRLYAQNVQRMGTPVYGKKWFASLLDCFGDKANLMVIEHQGEIISGVLSLFHQETILPYYAASNAKYWHLAPNDFQYWELMRHAVDRGCRFFDFGRSKKDTGHYRYKCHWGFEPQPLHYQYYLHNLDQLPELNPLNPKYKLKIAAWKKLPAWLAQRLGPHIVKYIP